MKNRDLPIVIVDDSKLSQAVISRALVREGYRDIRQANNAAEAIETLAERPASLVIADWMMPKMDGFELLAAIRQNDDSSNHFTFVLMVTGQEGQQVLEQAFERGVNDFIYKSVLSRELLPRAAAGVQLANQVNQLLEENQRLHTLRQTFQRQPSVDPELGMGNAPYAEYMFEKFFSHTYGRGGVLCVTYVDLATLRDMKQNHTDDVNRELYHEFCRRLQQQTRTMDIRCTYDNDSIVMLSLRSDIDQVDVSQFRRLFNKLSNKAYKTSAGFMSVTLNMAVMVIEAKHLSNAPNFSHIMKRLKSRISQGDERRIAYEVIEQDA